MCKQLPRRSQEQQLSPSSGGAPALVLSIFFPLQGATNTPPNIGSNTFLVLPMQPIHAPFPHYQIMECPLTLTMEPSFWWPPTAQGVATCWPLRPT